MWRWLLGWQFTALLAVLACAMAVGEFVGAKVEGGREPWVAFGFYVLAVLFYGWLTWHRYEHPRWMTAPNGGRASEPPR